MSESYHKIEGLQPVERAKAAPVVARVTETLDLFAEVVVAGSFRRELPFVGDLDFVVVPKFGYGAAEVWTTAREAFGPPFRGGKSKTVGGVEKWDKKGQFVVDGVVIDLYLSDSELKEPMLLFLTGSAETNKKMRWLAKSKGWVLSQYGLKDVESNEFVGQQTERGIFDSLGMEYLEPYQR